MLNCLFRVLRQQLKQLAQSAMPTQPTIAYPLQPVVVTNQQEYDSDSHSGSETSELEWLREERERMEAKQEVLEAHNKQLELQLYRLRLLLKEVRTCIRYNSNDDDDDDYDKNNNRQYFQC